MRLASLGAAEDDDDDDNTEAMKPSSFRNGRSKTSNSLLLPPLKLALLTASPNSIEIAYGPGPSTTKEAAEAAKTTTMIELEISRDTFGSSNPIWKSVYTTSEGGGGSSSLGHNQKPSATRGERHLQARHVRTVIKHDRLGPMLRIHFDYGRRCRVREAHCWPQRHVPVLVLKQHRCFVSHTGA